MPEDLKQSEVTEGKDPSVDKQWDHTTPKDTQFKDLYEIVDSVKVCMMTTRRDDVGLVSRAMGVAKREGPDFYFLANSESEKFKDLSSSDGEVQLVFHDSSSQNWVSISGKATKRSNTDPKIKELYSSFVSAWFGDLGDGKHDGTADDPRMALIEVQPTYIKYWKSETGAFGFLKEVAVAAYKGKVAQTGVLRELKNEDVVKARGSA